MKGTGKPGVFGLRSTRFFGVLAGRTGSLKAWSVAVLVAFSVHAAAGTQNYGSVTVSLEPPTDVASLHGYVVYRLTVANRGTQPRTVTVSLPAESWNYGDSIRRISKSVRVEPQSAAVTEMLQPPLPMNGNDATVTIDGAVQEDRLPVALVSHVDSYDGLPILVSRGIDGRVRTNFETAMTEVSERGSSSAYTSHGGYRGGRHWGYSDTLARMARAEWPVSEWSGNWLAYSRYFAVMVGEDELRSAPAPVDAALRDYAAAGGIVVVVGDNNRRPEPGVAWAAGWTYRVGDQDGDALGFGAGRVFHTAESVLTGFDTDRWEAWVHSRIRSTDHRRQRLDASSAESQLPMLETVRVPTRSLLFIMLLFTLLIGPVNIVALTLLKKRMWLLWTVPTIASIFAGGVLAYSVLSEGVRPRAKTVAVTLLDQDTRQAVTLGMTGYYAPLTPGEGLWYDDRTEVTPQSGDASYGYSGGGRTRTMDLTNGQHLSSGWVIARVPAHFALRQVETRRERLDISRNDDGGLTVVNGLGLPIKRLIVVDADRRAYRFDAVAAGGSTTASATELNATAHTSLHEQLAQRGALEFVNMARKDLDDFVFPGTYVAELDNASFLESGLDNLVSHDVTGVVVGRWTEGE
ncbi:MAG: hypothetical protein AAF333_06345 [Planctomycetota bacterium]